MTIVAGIGFQPVNVPHVHEPELVARFDGIRWRTYLRCRKCLTTLYEVLP